MGSHYAEAYVRLEEDFAVPPMNFTLGDPPAAEDFDDATDYLHAAQLYSLHYQQSPDSPGYVHHVTHDVSVEYVDATYKVGLFSVRVEVTRGEVLDVEEEAGIEEYVDDEGCTVRESRRENEGFCEDMETLNEAG
jgi:hypothetical protein